MGQRALRSDDAGSQRKKAASPWTELPVTGNRVTIVSPPRREDGEAMRGSGTKMFEFGSYLVTPHRQMTSESMGPFDAGPWYNLCEFVTGHYFGDTYNNTIVFRSFF